MKRRGFLSALCATLVASDPDELLWRAGARLISIPCPTKLVRATFWSIWLYGDVSKFSGYSDYGVLGHHYSADFGIGGGSRTKTSRDVLEDAKARLKNNNGRYTKAIWFAEDNGQKISGEIIWNLRK